MQILEQKNLKDCNTLGIAAKSKYYCIAESEEDLFDILKDSRFKECKKFILGSGSNTLFTGDYDGLIISLGMREIKIERVDRDAVYVRAGAGVDWDYFVAYCCDRGWGGVENLSHIPGTVGASPVQNIGAYGAEAADTIESVDYIEISNSKKCVVYKDDCRFGYRTSLFKTELKGEIIITSVLFKLALNPAININYADVQAELKDIKGATINDVREAVIAIRKRKLPDPKDIGNAGSFFKNPVVEKSIAERILKDFPDLKIYPAGEGMCKVPAAWLIEKCGYKGCRFGNVGVHTNQALVLVSYPGATGANILALASKISDSVMAKFGIKIEPEVNII